MLSDKSVIAANRFCYGPNSQDRTKLLKILPTSYLKEQLRPYSFPSSSWSSTLAIESFVNLNQTRRNMKGMPEVEATLKKIRQTALSQALKDAELSILQSIYTDQPLQARLLDFFSNHFSITQSNFYTQLLFPTIEKEVIAPNLNGKFGDMLKSVSQHPSMIVYLNNEKSVGPNSIIGKRNKRRGLNENFGREILELHTLGVDGPYDQNDVIALSKGISGWSVGQPGRDKDLGFKFRVMAHEPGNQILLEKNYIGHSAESGIDKGLSMLEDLSIHPSTAKHICFKLARHFISDFPNKELVDEMVKKYLDTDGHIPSVMITMIDHPYSWQPVMRKYKTPREFIISACRVCEIINLEPRISELLTTFGHGLFNAGSPAGYPDVIDGWGGPLALTNRISWASHFAKDIKIDVIDLANKTFGNLLSSSSKKHILRAESMQQALTMFLMSPEFQRR